MKTKPSPTTYELPVTADTSTVLGYGHRSEYGAKLWSELDWRLAWRDGGQHLFNPLGGQYLHVRVKWDRKEDGPRKILKWSRFYRVRCRYYIGGKFRRREVADVTVEKRGKRWAWIVRVK